MGIPALCQKILNEVKSLESQIANIQKSPGYIQGPKDPHPGRPDPESLAEVKVLEKKIAADISAFQACLLKFLADGYSYQSAAGQLNISINTVRNYIRSIYEKLHVNSKSEAVSKALRHRLIS